MTKLLGVTQNAKRYQMKDTVFQWRHLFTVEVVSVYVLDETEENKDMILPR